MKLDIENKILFPFLILVILPVLAVGIFFYQSSHNLFRARLEEEMVKDLSEINNIIDHSAGSKPEELLGQIDNIKKSKVIIYNKDTNKIYTNYELDDLSAVKSDVSSHLNNDLHDFDFLLQGEEKRVFYFKNNDKYNWYIGTEKILTPVTYSLLDIQKYTILVAIIFAIIAVEFTIFLAHNISKPLKKLASFCNIVSEGNYDQKVKINRRDEIGVLASSFNNMVKKIRHSTEEIKKVKEINEDILRSTTTGIISIDTEGRVITVNRAARQILQGKNNTTDKNIYKRLLTLSRQALQRQQAFDQIIDFSTDQGEKKVIEVNTSLLTGEEGRINGALCSFRDISERKRIEDRMEQVDRLSSLGQMAAGLAHEIRNPLTGIKTSAQVLEGRLENDQVSEDMFNNIISEIDRMNELVSDILDFARPREPHFTEIELKTIIDESIKLLEEYFNNNKIKIVKKYPGRKIRVKIDPDQCKQILINLFMNAIKAMQNGGKLTIILKDITRDFVKLKIRDNGKGIKEEDLERIFEPFFSTYKSGTGLGLSVVKRLIIENRGDIRVNSKLNCGTEFIISLPKHRGDSDE